MAALRKTAATTIGLGLVVLVSAIAPAHASVTATQRVTATQGKDVVIKIKVDRSAKRCTVALTGPTSKKIGKRSVRKGVVRVSLSTASLPPGKYRVTAKCGQSKVRKAFLQVTSNEVRVPEADPVPRTLAPSAHPDLSMAATDTTSVEVDVLANDTDPYAEPLRVIGVSAPDHGTTSIASELKVVYTPVPGFVGTDSFNYTIARSDGPPATATATVHVAPQIAIDTFNAVNQARASARECSTGVESPAVAPLVWNTKLAAAATRHSLDMATNNFFSHTSPTDLSSIPGRVTDEGYSWSIVGEHIAGGSLGTGQGFVAMWLGDPSGCREIMDARFTESGVGYGYNSSATLQKYVTHVFAQPTR